MEEGQIDRMERKHQCQISTDYNLEEKREAWRQREEVEAEASLEGGNDRASERGSC